MLCQAQKVNWFEVQKKVKQVVGECVAESQVINFANRVKEFRLFTDWSKDGIRFCLFVDERLVKIGSEQLPRWSKVCGSFLSKV